MQIRRFYFERIFQDSYTFCFSKCFRRVLSNRRSESESEEEEEEELPLLSEEEMNKLGAKLVKAELMGNTVSSHRREYRTGNMNSRLKVV